VHAGFHGGAEAGENLVRRAGAVDVGGLALLAVFLNARGMRVVWMPMRGREAWSC
jgi:hypothetical protein